MAEDTRYNGWTNYETWNVSLWIGNEQGSQQYWAGVAQECWDDAEAEWHHDGSPFLSRDEAATRLLAERLKGEFEEGKQNLLDTAKVSSSVWADLLGAALSEVDWQEIATGMIADDVDKSEADEVAAR